MSLAPACWVFVTFNAQYYCVQDFVYPHSIVLLEDPNAVETPEFRHFRLKYCISFSDVLGFCLFVCFVLCFLANDDTKNYFSKNKKTELFPLPLKSTFKLSRPQKPVVPESSVCFCLGICHRRFGTVTNDWGYVAGPLLRPHWRKGGKTTGWE